MQAAPIDTVAYEALQAENQMLREQLARVTHELAQLKRLIFGTRSERFVPTGGPDQLPLFEDIFSNDTPEDEQHSTAASETVNRRRPRKKPVRQVLPSHLPREVVVIEPEIETAGLRKIGEEVSETLDYRPAKLVVIRRVRAKYVDPDD